MRWRLRRKPDTSTRLEAEHALLRAQGALEATRRRAPEVDKVTSNLIRMHELNHWSEQFKAAMARRY